MSWTDYASAPDPGTELCPEHEVRVVHPVVVTTERGSFPVLLLRDGDAIRAFVNACPHQYLPLNYRGDQLLTADGTALICTAHGARFDRHSGAVLEGADCGLDPVPVACRDGMVIISD